VENRICTGNLTIPRVSLRSNQSGLTVFLGPAHLPRGGVDEYPTIAMQTEHLHYVVGQYECLLVVVECNVQTVVAAEWCTVELLLLLWHCCVCDVRHLF
jgi:hypothetical protein